MQNRCVCYLSERNPNPHHMTYPFGDVPLADPISHHGNLESDDLIAVPTLPNCPYQFSKTL